MLKSTLPMVQILFNGRFVESESSSYAYVWARDGGALLAD